MTEKPIVDQPVGGTPCFFGRDRALRMLRNGLERGRSFGLIGGPGIGRTSTLMELAAREQRRWVPTYRGAKVVPVLVDFRSLPSGNPAALADGIWQGLGRAISDPRVRGGAGALDQPKLSLRGDAKTAWKTFEDGLRELWGQLRGSEAWCQYAVLLDNAECAESAVLIDMLEPLIQLASRDEDYTPTSLVISGARRLRESLYERRGPMYGMLTPVLLGALTDHEASTFIRAVLPMATAAHVRELGSVTGNHPNLLARVLSEIVNYNLIDKLRVASDNASMRAETYFESVWAVIDDGRELTYRGSYAAPEHAIMQTLIQVGAKGLTSKQLEREIGMRPIKEYTEVLEYLGVIERSMRGSTFVLQGRCALWNDWYRERIAS